ncbi:MAG: sulfotransferase [Cellvibrionaceae bacterium]|nr:sulfotransferase [Cellvibrionaceae bacterium]
MGYLYRTKTDARYPANTTRTPYLLEQFPNARFVYIYRNPYAVYDESTKNLYRKVGPHFHLRNSEIGTKDENIVHIYREMIESYHAKFEECLTYTKWLLALAEAFFRA